jgi:hypothetical protein
MRDSAYERIETSEVLSEVPLARIAHYAAEVEQHEALKAFQRELRG